MDPTTALFIGSRSGGQLARSALPDAPVVPDAPRRRTRRIALRRSRPSD
jgi:hypothetical protein